MRAVVSAPASSANLGSGFDAVALALELRLRIEVVTQPAAGREYVFDGPERPDHDGLRGAIDGAIDAYAGGRALPGLALRVTNAIPLGAGLGSSAAARAAGAAVAALALDGGLDRHACARVAVALEGHADNALAAAFGGIAIGTGADPSRSLVVAPPAALRAAVVVPDAALATEQARALLPPSYPRADVAVAVGRAALLGAALAAGRLDLLREAVRDVVHQPHRARAYPWLDAVLADPSSDAYAVALSGAGPALIALARPDRAAAALAMLRNAVEGCGVGVRLAAVLAPAPSGVACEALADL